MLHYFARSSAVADKPRDALTVQLGKGVSDPLEHALPKALTCRNVFLRHTGC